jgi:hypothetical protein
MKRIVALALTAAALAVPASQALASSAATGPTAAQFKALQKQVKTLQAQVKALQKFVPASCTASSCLTVKELTNGLDAAFPLLVCHDAVIADEFQATWNVIDQISTATQQGKTYFGPQTSISDSGACALFQLTRPAAIPPTVAIFSSLVNLIAGSPHPFR